LLLWCVALLLLSHVRPAPPAALQILFSFRPSMVSLVPVIAVAPRGLGRRHKHSQFYPSSAGVEFDMS